jgi:hypothetical protein
LVFFGFFGIATPQNLVSVFFEMKW